MPIGEVKTMGDAMYARGEFMGVQLFYHAYI